MYYNGKKYSSKKHPVLEYIFNTKNPSHEIKPVIQFTLQDISDGYKHCGIDEPASISNTILDLTRQDRGIDKRLPESIYSLGYDLRKKTGNNLAGEFVYVGEGNALTSWFNWPTEYDMSFTINPNQIPEIVLPYIRQDEGALFSVIDYCDIFSNIMQEKPNTVLRVQNPLKWQPNEIDGFYAGKHSDGTVLYPVEAKALTTGDAINLEQMLGAIKLLHTRYSSCEVYLQPIAARMIENGIQFAFFQKLKAGSTIEQLECVKTIIVYFTPVLKNWIK